jgi:hypothetical protein
MFWSNRDCLAGKPATEVYTCEKNRPWLSTMVAEVSRFYICLDNLHNVARCVGSKNDGTVITIAGVPAGGGVVAMFTGVVELVEHDPKRGPNREWFITMKGPN